MTIRPILFQPDMVRAILEGRKTQTRRVLKEQQHIFHVVRTSRRPLGKPSQVAYEWHSTTGHYVGDVCLPYARGDLLYVREAWRTWSLIDLTPPKFMQSSEIVLYEADGTVNKHNPRFVPGRFRQAMHMPRWASRLTLEVTDVRVQRVQQISGQDAVAEGVMSRLPDNGIAQAEFKDLWDRINGPRGLGWDANPWVVALNFNVHRRNVDNMEKADD
jgi:hypothetical protein